MDQANDLMDLSHSILLANVFSGPCNQTTSQWIADHFGPERSFGCAKSVPLVLARNSMIRDGALPSITPDTNWVFFIDNDVTITHPGVESFLAVPGDVVSCECQCRNPAAWTDPQAFHCNFWRCRPAVLKAITAPWFSVCASDDGCDLISCECTSFQRRALAAGFSVAHGGNCGHAMQGDWIQRGESSYDC